MFVEANNQIVHCVGVPCVASGNDDLVYERVGNRKKDRILLKGGDDQAHANTSKRDRDVIKGSSGFDLIYVNDGDRKDKIFGAGPRQVLRGRRLRGGERLLADHHPLGGWSTRGVGGFCCSPRPFWPLGSREAYS